MIGVQVQIRCDTSTCAATYPANGWAPDRRTAWRDARTAGWVRDFEQHHCPQHVPPSRRVDVDRVRELAGAGLTDGQMGARLGLSRGQVQHLRTRHSIEGRRPGRPRGGA